ncbi:6-phosphogluconolactonase [Nocardioides flavus (ex Wang et al. 2016)]|uniref:6-phosphogluconolactonase n=1 Tax=Nocardioides flavus (ex Wang et al. 2016) TaxID=2058780 RepID=A0ABQ3HQ08_9ACTN|nr:6-phosphogluconolactonase [Nocardioides flavus (ex Wang et al. 2016)]GHE18850.1 6-phosphogluconolactonase [Nocardioides flavus (ex Wang et al. 2016)]
MSAAEVRRHDDADVLVGDVASALLERIEAAQARGETPDIGLTGGSIAEELHRELARRAPDSSVDWSRVAFWWGDERFVAADSPDRNAGQARESLLDHVAVDPARVHEVPASDQVAAAEEAAEAYAAALREHGSGTFEVLMLGIGPDGHCASMFPGHPALDVRDAVAVAVHDSPKPPPDRVSLTFEAMNRSRAVWFIASGEGKAEAVARALAPEGTVAETPARGVRGAETVWWLDEAAASAL